METESYLNQITVVRCFTQQGAPYSTTAWSFQDRWCIRDFRVAYWCGQKQEGGRLLQLYVAQWLHNQITAESED